jgi:hypothetical protein
MGSPNGLRLSLCQIPCRCGRPRYDAPVTNAARPTLASPSSSIWPAVGSSALVSACFLVAFISSCALLSCYLPFPEVPTVREKIEYLARHGDEYDILFLGSSRIHQHIMPALFDEIVTANGLTVRSFNAGIPAMVAPENGYLLEEILRRPHRRLRWVFVELTTLGAQAGSEETSRFVYWHDNVRMAFLTRIMWTNALWKQRRLAKDPATKFLDRWDAWTVIAGRFWVHAHAWLVRSANLNRGSEVLNLHLEGPGWHDHVGKDLNDKDEGWAPASSRRQQMEAKLREEYQRAYADRLATPAVKDRGDPFSQVALERMLTAITKAGARPVLIVPPTMAGRNFYPSPERERELAVLDFSDVRQYPDLFAPEHRMDLGHLNTAGAEIFTRILAGQFVKIATGRTPAP